MPWKNPHWSHPQWRNPEWKKVLEGIKVCDFSWVGVGPVTSRELAANGAFVIRIESHKRPDTLRLAGPFSQGIRGINRSGHGHNYNVNKYGISLDLRQPKAKEIASKLVAWADICCDSMTPGSLAKLGFDYESCKKINPSIIYYSSCQMGQKGPYAPFGGYGAYGVAYGGYCSLTGWPDRTPLPLWNNYSDFISPWYLTGAVVLALLYRRKTGKGMYLDQSQVESGVSFSGPALLDYMVNGCRANRCGNRDRYMAPHGVYPCIGTDQHLPCRYVAIAAQNEEQWRAFCKVIGEPAWTGDPKFATLLARKENEDELDSLVAEWTKDYTPEQVMSMMQAARVPAGIVARNEDLFNDPQVKHRGKFVRLPHIEMTAFDGQAPAYQTPAYKLSRTPPRAYKAGPGLGEDNEYVFKEILGLSDDYIAEALIDGAITTEMDLPELLRPRR